MLGIFLDTETNGLDPFSHRVLEIAFKLIDLKTGVFIDSYEAIVCLTDKEWESSDPVSLQVNGFTKEKMARGKSKEEVSSEIQACFAKHNIQRGKAVFICQNPSFDRPFFAQLIPPMIQEKKLWPYHWLDLASMHFATALTKGKKAPWETGLSKDKIAVAYSLPEEKKPHQAINGVDHLLACYEAVVGFSNS